MKTLMKQKKTFRLSAVFTLLVSGLCRWSLQADQTNPDLEPTTNGIYATGRDWGNLTGVGGHLISITIHFTSPNTNISVSPWPEGSFNKNTNGITVAPHHSRRGIYFMATNSFCGFIALSDATGRNIPLIKPEVNSIKAYPPYYNLRSATHLSNPVIDSYLLPSALSGSSPDLSFQLEDCFKIPKPGEYQLAIQPIIYKRSATNEDVCERMNLSPVIIPIKWDGNLSK